MINLSLIILISSVVFVNGWTDAPNAIAGIVVTKAMPYRKAVSYAALCNLFGLLTMSFVNASVAKTVAEITDFSTQNSDYAMLGLIAVMASIVIFAVAAWFFGIPTSESHALIAALAGASLSLGCSVNMDSVKKVLIGLLMSVIPGFLFGYLLSKLFRGPLNRLGGKAMDKLQIASAGVSAFMHGAQDGLKFAAVFIIAELFSKNQYNILEFAPLNHALVLVYCAFLMAAGTLTGGRRIIDTVGAKMVRLEKYQSVCADFASGLCLLAASLTGVPMSTTHTKTTAIMGAGISTGKDAKHPADIKIIGGMLLAWIITFPACILLGFVITKALLRLV